MNQAAYQHIVEKFDDGSNRGVEITVNLRTAALISKSLKYFARKSLTDEREWMSIEGRAEARAMALEIDREVSR